MSKRSYKRLMVPHPQLSLANPPPTTETPRARPSAPTILMESAPVEHTQRPVVITRSLTFAEVLASASPVSSLGSLPQMPSQPRYGRHRPNEPVIRPVARAGRGLNRRSANRSTTSSTYSLKPTSVQRTISSESMKTLKPPYPRNRVSFAALKDVREQDSPPKPEKKDTILSNEDVRRSSFPWAAPSAELEAPPRRFSSPVRKRMINQVCPISPSVLARMRKTVSRYMHTIDDIPMSARSAPSRRMSMHRAKRNSEGSTTPKERINWFVGIFTIRRTGMKAMYRKRSSASHEKRLSIPELSAAFALGQPSHKGSRQSSATYHGSDGKAYTIPQATIKKATWLPSEMTRINTPPLAVEAARKSSRPPRAFFFDYLNPPQAGDEDKEKDKPRGATSTPVLRPSPVAVDSSLTVRKYDPSANAQTPSVLTTLTSTSSWMTLSPRQTKKSSMSTILSPQIGRTEASMQTPGGDSIRSDQTDYFRQRIDAAADDIGNGEFGEFEYAWNVPDHLPNSPLCPMNAELYGLIKGGNGIARRKACPLHEMRSVRRGAKAGRADKSGYTPMGRGRGGRASQLSLKNMM